MRQEFKKREIYETGILTALDLLDRNLNSVISMKQEFKQREIYETGI